MLMCPPAAQLRAPVGVGAHVGAGARAGAEVVVAAPAALQEAGMTGVRATVMQGKTALTVPVKRVRASMLRRIRGHGQTA